MALGTLFRLALAVTRRILPDQQYDFNIAVAKEVDALGGVALSFNTIATGAVGSGRLIDITAAEISTLNTGAVVWTESVKDQWYWEPTATTAPDNITIATPLAAGVGAGRFYRRNIPAQEWQRQATFFVDNGNVNASDENNGATNVTPLSTWGEYRRRVGSGPLLAAQSVSIGPTNLAVTDVFDVSNLSPGAFTLQILGIPTVTVPAQAIAAYTPRVAATNTPNQLTSVAVTAWTPLIGGGRFIRMTSGASNGNLSTACLDLTGNAARVGTFLNVVQAETQPVANDTYEIVTLPQVTLSRMNPILPGVLIARLNFVTNQVRVRASGPLFGTTTANAPGVDCIFFNCCFTLGPAFSGSMYWIGCQFMTATGTNVAFFEAAQAQVSAGSCFFDGTAGKYQFLGGSLAQWSVGTIFQGCGMTVQRGSFKPFNVSFFDTGTTAINAIENANVECTTIYGNTGAGNPGAITLDRTCHVGLIGATQTLTNGGGIEIVMPLIANTTWAAVRAAGGVKDGLTSDASAMVAL